MQDFGERAAGRGGGVGVGVADGDEGNELIAGGNAQDVGDALLAMRVVAANPAGGQAQGGGGEEDVLRGGAAIFEVPFAGFAEDGDAEARGGDELAVFGDLGDAFALRGLGDDDELAGLEVAGGGSVQAGGDDLLDGGTVDGLRRVLADAVATLDGFEEIHNGV